MSHFTDAEIELLNSLPFDSAARPIFDPIRSCLRWHDEEPARLAGGAYERFLDLLVVRSFIHQDKPESQWFSISPTTYFTEIWTEAQQRAPNWPGFRRINLDSGSRDLFERESSKALSQHF